MLKIKKIRKNDGGDSKDGLGDWKDDSVAKEKNKRKIKVSNNNAMPLDVNFKTFVDVIM